MHSHPSPNTHTHTQLWEMTKIFRAKIDEIRNDFNAKYQEYIKLDRNFNAYMRNIKHQE